MKVTFTREQLYGLDAETIDELLRNISNADNDKVSQVLAGYQDSCEIDVPESVLIGIE